MDWLQQSRGMLKNWMDMQDSMWRSWLNTSDKPSQNAWEHSLQTWENGFKNYTEMQAMWARMWARNMMTGNDTDGAKAFVGAVEDMTKTWVDLQTALLDSWLKMAKMMDPAQMQTDMPDDMQTYMDAWREQLTKMMDMQREWSEQAAKLMKAD
jgi:hypothetical protein